MQMGHRFAAIGTVVDDEAVAGLVQAKGLGHGGGLEQQMSQQGMIGGLRLGDARHGFLGHDQNMGGRLRGDVAEGEDQIIFLNDRGRDFAGGDFLKQRFAHAGLIPETGVGCTLRNVAAGIPACRRGQHIAAQHLTNDQPLVPAERFPPGWKHRLYGRQDARRYGS